MPAAKTADPQHDSLQIAPHDKFYSRLLSKETSSAPSFRVYYGGSSGAVPFTWESQPGTPKNTITTSTLPPLTPPPSYHFTPKKKNTTTTKKPSPNTNNSLMHRILPRLAPRRTSPLSSPSVSSSGSSGSRQRSRFSSPQSSFDDNEPGGDEGSPTSTLCSREHHGENGSLSGCYSMVIVKNALLSIVGSRGSSQGTTAAA